MTIPQEHAYNVYRLAPEGFQRVRRRVVRWSLIVMPFVLVGGLWAGSSKRPLSDASWWAIAAGGAVGSLAMIVGGVRALRQGREAWLNFELHVSDEGIVRRTKNCPDIHISRHEITALRSFPNGLRVETADGNRRIFIDCSLIGFNEVRNRLEMWMPTQPSKATQGSLVYGTTAALGTVAAMFVVLRSDNRLIVVPLGTVLIVVLLWAFVMIRKSPHVDTRTKRLIWMMIFPVITIGSRVYSALVR